MSAITLSTDLDRDVAERVTALAKAEDRTVASLMATAVAVFTDLPKPVRDALAQARSGADGSEAGQLARAMEAAIARHRFDRAAAALAGDSGFGRDRASASELEVLEAATQISAVAAVSHQR